MYYSEKDKQMINESNEIEKAKIVDNKQISITILLAITFLIAQFFNMFGITWSFALLIICLFFYISSISGDMNSYLNVYQLERELLKRDLAIMELEKEISTLYIKYKSSRQ